MYAALVTLSVLGCAVTYAAAAEAPNAKAIDIAQTMMKAIGDQEALLPPGLPPGDSYVGYLLFWQPGLYRVRGYQGGRLLGTVVFGVPATGSVLTQGTADGQRGERTPRRPAAAPPVDRRHIFPLEFRRTHTTARRARSEQPQYGRTHCHPGQAVPSTPKSQLGGYARLSARSLAWTIDPQDRSNGGGGRSAASRSSRGPGFR